MINLFVPTYTNSTDGWYNGWIYKYKHMHVYI